MGGAKAHRDLVVGIMPMLTFGQAIARGHLDQQGEMQRRLLVDRRDAIGPTIGSLCVTAGDHEGVEFAGRTPAFCASHRY